MTSNNIFILILLQQYPSCFVDAVLSESQPASSLQYGYRSVLFLWTMPQNLLHTAYIHALFYQIGRKRMTEHMWGYVSFYAGLVCIFFQHQADGLLCD